jgi:acyl-[acyl-carrier-protein]-phospholipid O-acyltransferase/long-chain-fatty-acid--[acyl-carrier-protein] ligase
LFNDALLRGQITATFVPYAMIGITVFTLDLFWASHSIPLRPHLESLSGLFHDAGHWRIIFDLMIISLCGGLFVVPLDAIIQHRTPEDHRARLLAGNAIISSFFVALASIVSAGMIAAHMGIALIFACFAVANGGMALLFLRR